MFSGGVGRGFDCGKIIRLFFKIAEYLDFTYPEMADTYAAEWVLEHAIRSGMKVLI